MVVFALWISETERGAGENYGYQQRACQKINTGDKLFAVLNAFQAGHFINGFDGRARPGPTPVRSQGQPGESGGCREDQGQNAEDASHGKERFAPRFRWQSESTQPCRARRVHLPFESFASGYLATEPGAVKNITFLIRSRTRSIVTRVGCVAGS